MADSAVAGCGSPHPHGPHSWPPAFDPDEPPRPHGMISGRAYCSGLPAIPLRAGDVLYGFCNGKFGRDAYGDKVVEAIGRDWVMVREDGTPLLYVGKPEDLCYYRVPVCEICGHNSMVNSTCTSCGMVVR